MEDSGVPASEGNEKKPKYRNMSALENEVYTPFLFARDGRVCTKKYGYGCGRTLEELIEIREEEMLLTGKIFTTKAYTIDHINGDSNQRDGDDGTYCGNLEIQCWSCNRRKGGKEIVRSINSSKEKSQEKQDYVDGVPALLNWTTTKLIQNEEMCYKELINASRESNGLSPVTNERNLETEIASKARPRAKFQIFKYDCGSRKCTHEHFCFNGDKPTKLIAAEKKRLLDKWTKEYGTSKKDYDQNRSIYDIHKTWMTFDEYVLAYGNLLLQDFSFQKFDDEAASTTKILSS